LIATTGFTSTAIKNAVGDMTGMLAHFAMATPPDGWLKRNGAAVSRSTYSALFAKLGTLYGAGDGSTTFNLPDDRGSFDRGWSDNGSVDAGRAFGSKQDFMNASHIHSATAASAGSHNHTSSIEREKITAATVTDPGSGNAVLGDINTDGIQTVTSSTAPAHTHTITVAASGGVEARPYNGAYLACIKY
jgi:microcystin-dependent protein